jgi:hypothetical protein
MSVKSNLGFMRFASMAFQMIAIILVFTFLGKYIDTYKIIDFQIFTVVGVLLGLSIALYQGFKSIKQIK